LNRHPTQGSVFWHQLVSGFDSDSLRSGSVKGRIPSKGHHRTRRPRGRFADQRAPSHLAAERIRP